MTAVTAESIQQIPNLISFWDFQEPAGKPRVAKGPHPYALQEMAGPIVRVDGGLFGPHAAFLRPKQWLSASRKDCPALNIHGPQAQVSVVAWFKRYRKPEIQCEFLAGIWDESRAKRQYGLFLDLRMRGGADQIAGHVSGLGGPTPGNRWCMDAAIAYSEVPYFEHWHCGGFTYDGQFTKAYHNGWLDENGKLNPYEYKLGIFDAGDVGGDFTVGAVDRLGSIGNWFTGLIGGVAVFDRALSDAEMDRLASVLPARPRKDAISDPLK